MKESRTALGVAWMRALHQVLDSKPLILEDEPIVELLGRYYVERASKATERFQAPGARMLRSHVVLRSRFTEDRLEQALSRGAEQFVILGAGYDTFFARQPDWAKNAEDLRDRSARDAGGQTRAHLSREAERSCPTWCSGA